MRDQALRMARRPAPAIAPEPDAPAQEEIAPASWPYAGERWVVAGDAPHPLNAAPSPRTMRARRPQCHACKGGLVASSLAVESPFFTVTAPHHGGDIRPVQRPEVRLATLLAGDGVDSAEPMSPAQEEEARQCLERGAGGGKTLSLDRQREVEHWAARLLAQAGRRCAPILEQAVDAMGWGRLAGRLNEDPAIAFLNARAAGYRFQREVQSPDHPDHKAWGRTEPPRPGEHGAQMAGRAQGCTRADHAHPSRLSRTGKHTGPGARGILGRAAPRHTARMEDQLDRHCRADGAAAGVDLVE
jgi:hypothetical protein